MRAASAPQLPYHRVIAAGGRLGGYGGRESFKAALLSAEGLTVRRGRVLDYTLHSWPSPQTETRRPRR